MQPGVHPSLQQHAKGLLTSLRPGHQGQALKAGEKGHRRPRAPREIKVRKEKLKTHSDYVKGCREGRSGLPANLRTFHRQRLHKLRQVSGRGTSRTRLEDWRCIRRRAFSRQGARPEHRLEPSNIWLQCKACNAGSSKYARKGLTVSQGFREGLIERIGLEAVEALEADHRPRKYTNDELKAITAEYRAKLRELKRVTA